MLTPLEPWIASKIGVPPGARLTHAAVRDYQLDRLRATVDRARENSPFYRELLAEHSSRDLRTLDDVSALPFTTPADILGDDLRFLCVSQAQIERVVTLRTSGTTNAAKRIHFTAADLELTVDFFRHGMATLVAPGDRVLILMPGESIGSVGDSLSKGLALMGAEGIVHGIVRDESAAIAGIVAREIDCLVGLPVQVLGLARHQDAVTIPAGRIKSVLLSADYVPAAIVREIERVFDVPVYNHYGMTEMGLGGAVDCRERSGYHVREADLYIEIVDPATGVPMPDGSEGEVVFTTLTRVGMPLIRYRTGDVSRFVPGPCACGTVLKRLAWVGGRLSDRKALRGGGLLGMADLDEALFAVPGLRNFQAALTDGNGRDTLGVSVFAPGVGPDALRDAILEALNVVPALERALAQGSMEIGPIAISEENWLSSGSIKRALLDRRESTIC